MRTKTIARETGRKTLSTSNERTEHTRGQDAREHRWQENEKDTKSEQKSGNRRRKIGNGKKYNVTGNEKWSRDEQKRGCSVTIAEQENTGQHAELKEREGNKQGEKEKLDSRKTARERTDTKARNSNKSKRENSKMQKVVSE